MKGRWSFLIFASVLLIGSQFIAPLNIIMRVLSAEGTIGSAGFPAWSPDGNYIAFVSEQAGLKSLWVMQSDGQNPINLTQGFDTVDTSFSWSPDSDRIVFAGKVRGSAAFNIWTVKSDGSEPFNLSVEAGLTDSLYVNPLWSPDGQFIAVEQAVVDRTDVIIVSLTDFDTVNITENIGTENRDASWSPDSRYLAIYSRTKSLENAEDWSVPDIYVVSIDGSSSKKITEWLQSALDQDIGEAVSRLKNITGIVWSPTGEFIAFSAEYLTSPDIYLVDPDGENHYWIFGFVEDLTPNWSPDGQQFAYISLFPRMGESEIYVQVKFDDPVAAENRTYYHDGSLNLNPDWSPSGEKIVFQSNRAGESDIWIMDADGSNPVNLTAD